MHASGEAADLYEAIVQFSGPGARAVVSSPVSVAIARGKHLFPFRTEKLSPSAPMVLGPQGPGRVGRRRFFIEGSPRGAALFFVPLFAAFPCPPAARQARTDYAAPRASALA